MPGENRERLLRLVGTDALRPTRPYKEELLSAARTNGFANIRIRNASDLKDARLKGTSGEFLDALLEDLEEFVEIGQNPGSHRIDRFLETKNEAER